MMFEKFFSKYPTFEILEKPSEELLNQYRSVLPEPLIELWESHGLGVYMDGFLRLVDPNDFHDFVRESVNVYVENTVVFATSALGDFFLWENDRIKQVNFRYGYTEVVGGRRFASFMNHRLTDQEYLDDIKGSIYFKALDKLGQPEFDECYGYVPALVIGGNDNHENLQRLKMAEHLMIVSEFTGVIE